MSKTQPARGMRDFLPVDVRKRNYVIGVIKEVYEKYGFEPLETPAVENIETLMGKYGEEGNQLIFKILKRGEKLDIAQGEKGLSDLALRYDLTVPTARVVANYKNELPKFFKRYQIQPVWRADRPARGRFREFYQCDVDAIGSKSMIVEAELISAVCEVLERLGFVDFVVRINHRKLLSAFMATLNIPIEAQTKVLVAIDKIEKIGFEGVKKELSEFGISEEVIERVNDVLEEFYARSPSSLRADPLAADINQLDKLALALGKLSDANEPIDQLKWLFESLNETYKLSDFHTRFDFSLVRGLSYYTGTIFEVILTDGDFSGSIGGGGRYDGLIGMFGKEEIPACGFSLGLERILVVMEERGMFDKLIAEGKLKADSADVMVTVWNEESIAESLKLAAELRAAGKRVLVYPEADKLGKQFKYAGQIGVPYVCVLGESELAEGKVTLKNMQTGQQETIGRDNISSEIA